MAEKGIKSEVILSPDASSQPQMDILDKGSPFYTVKLAAAVTVWTALKRDPSLLRGKTPKQAAEDWLHGHAQQLGLIKLDGEINSSGIDEVAKIVNWAPQGGAPKTP